MLGTSRRKTQIEYHPLNSRDRTIIPHNAPPVSYSLPRLLVGASIAPKYGSGKRLGIGRSASPSQIELIRSRIVVGSQKKKVFIATHNHIAHCSYIQPRSDASVCSVPLLMLGVRCYDESKGSAPAAVAPTPGNYGNLPHPCSPCSLS